MEVELLVAVLYMCRDSKVMQTQTHFLPHLCIPDILICHYVYYSCVLYGQVVHVHINV